METNFSFTVACHSIERRIADFTPEEKVVVRMTYRLSYLEAVRLIGQIKIKKIEQMKGGEQKAA